MKCIDDIAALCLDPPFPPDFDTDISTTHSAIVKAVADFKDGNITADNAIAKISSSVDSIVMACENKKKECLAAVDGDFTTPLTPVGSIIQYLDWLLPFGLL